MTSTSVPASPSTTSTAGARDHARSQEGRSARSMRTVPARTATDLRDVAPERVVWDETLGGWRSTVKTLSRGTRLRFTDVDGDACAQLLLFNALAPHERLNVADTAKVQWQAYLTTGSLLLTDMGRVIATVVDDGASGHHDLFCGPSHGNGVTVGDEHPTSRSLLELAVARVGLERRDIHPCVNLFKGVRVEGGDALTFTGGAGAGVTVEVRLELPAHVVVANTPHVLDDGAAPDCSPLRITAWNGAAGGEGDEWRSATPEGGRAFENTEDFLLGHPLVGTTG